jgi:hypothetical protein
MERKKPIKKDEADRIINEILVGIRKQKAQRLKMTIIAGICLLFLVMIVVFLSSFNSVPEDSGNVNVVQVQTAQADTNGSTAVGISASGIGDNSNTIFGMPFWFVMVVITGWMIWRNMSRHSSIF